MTIVDQSHLDKWGESFDTLYEVAIDNLRQREGGGFVQITPGVYESGWKDDHDAGRLLLDDTLRGLDIDGDPVVVLPTRNKVFVTGSKDVRALAAVLETAMQISEVEPSPISNLPLVRRWPRWEALELSEGHPAYTVFSKVRAIELGQLYADQKTVLDEALEADGDGDEDFVATLMIYQRDDGALYTLATWTSGVRILLPEADVVAFVDPDRGDDAMITVAPWTAVVEICGASMQRHGYAPPRWRVTDFPDEAMLEQLRARAQ